jgi:phosphosulfolactate synthase (CoM biosynthesis protein A)
MFVAGTWVRNKFFPIVVIINFGGNMYKVKSNIALYKDNYGHITTKRSKFYKNQNPMKEVETDNVDNFLTELKNAGLEIVEIHSDTTYRDAENAYEITPSFSDFPIPA